jgi:glycosyltransferase involved in cell wall biosynthesis
LKPLSGELTLPRPPLLEQRRGVRGRIAVFSATLGGGGAERVMATLANGFHRAGHEVDVVLVQRAGGYLDELDAGVSVVDLRSSRILFALYPLIRYLRRVRPAAMVATLPAVNIVAVLARLIASTPTCLAVRQTNTAVVGSKGVPDYKARVIGKLTSTLYPLADLVIAPSQGVADNLINRWGIAARAITVIPNPLDTRLIQKRAGEPVQAAKAGAGEVPIVLGVGRLTTQKDFPTLVHAVRKVLETVQVKLLIAGEGRDRGSLQDLIRSSGLDDHIVLLGFVDNPFAYMRHASVYVLSSRWEGLSNTLLQALVLGVPVVATDCPGGSREILEDGRWGRLVPVGDAAAMAAAIIDGVEGRIDRPPVALLEERYGTDAVVGRYLEALKIHDRVHASEGRL